MSYEHGMMALRLEMPPRVPRTEFSIESHWAVVKAVTGMDVNENSPQQLRSEASRAFVKAWNYDFIWCTIIGGGELSAKRTSMGHAVYAAGGVDYDTNISSAFTDPEDVFALDIEATYPHEPKGSLIKRFEDSWRSIRETHDAAPTTGVYITQMSGMIDMLGWDLLLMCAGLDPDRFGRFLGRYTDWVKFYFEALAESDVPTVMIHDDMVWTEGAFIHPDWYRRYLFPNLKKLLSPLREAGKIIAFTSDGSYTEFIDDIAGCGVHGFVLEPITDMRAVAERYGKTHFFIGNADTNVLLFGSREDIEAEVKRCMDIGKKCPGFFMAVGNHIPPNTPVDSCLFYNEVYERMSRR